MLSVVVPPAEVRTTLTTPEAWAGAFTMTSVSDTLSMLVSATPPKVTEVVSVRPLPVMVTDPPELAPATGLLDGETLVMAGAAT